MRRPVAESKASRSGCHFPEAAMEGSCEDSRASTDTRSALAARDAAQEVAPQVIGLLAPEAHTAHGQGRGRSETPSAAAADWQAKDSIPSPRCMRSQDHQASADSPGQAKLLDGVVRLSAPSAPNRELPRSRRIAAYMRVSRTVRCAKKRSSWVTKPILHPPEQAPRANSRSR